MPRQNKDDKGYQNGPGERPTEYLPAKAGAPFPGKKTENVMMGIDSLSEEIAKLTMTRQIIKNLMNTTLQPGVHYGSFPGINRKCLLKPGADCLCVLFKFRLSFTHERFDFEGGHREYSFKCTVHSPGGEFLAEGVGSCSTMESKYRYRTQRRVCPNCGKETIYLSKYEPEFYCYAKSGGCGAKYSEDDPLMTEQKVGKIENPDLADIYNTVFKIAEKRAQIDAVIRATGCSEEFTQDLEDLSSVVEEMDTQAGTAKAAGAKAAADRAPAGPRERKAPAEKGAPPAAAAPSGPPDNGGEKTVSQLLMAMGMAVNADNAKDVTEYIDCLRAKTLKPNGEKYSLQSIIGRGLASPEKIKVRFKEYMDSRRPKKREAPLDEGFHYADGQDYPGDPNPLETKKIQERDKIKDYCYQNGIDLKAKAKEFSPLAAFQYLTYDELRKFGEFLGM
jgi:hypothetical protein